MAAERHSRRRYSCRFCGFDFPAWLSAAQRPDGAMLLQYLSAMPRDHVGPYLDWMAADEDITPVAAETYEVIKEA
jgi:hypothetical protein